MLWKNRAVVFLKEDKEFKFTTIYDRSANSSLPFDCCCLVPMKSSQPGNYKSSIRPTELFRNHHLHRWSPESVVGRLAGYPAMIAQRTTIRLASLAVTMGVTGRVQRALAEISRDGQCAG